MRNDEGHRRIGIKFPTLYESDTINVGATQDEARCCAPRAATRPTVFVHHIVAI